jgi:hypothetical protein
MNDMWHAKPRERVSVPVDEDKDVIDEEDDVDEEDATVQYRPHFPFTSCSGKA